MAIIFTICSNNYLAQATVLGNSIKKNIAGTQFFTILVDEIDSRINYNELPFTCIPIKQIEENINELIEKYDIIELNTCVKPQVFKYFFENYNESQVIYFDPDIELYDSLQEFDTLFQTYDILLTPHIFTPIDIDGQTPSENVFLNYGIYNLGFIAVQKSEETLRFLNWWKDRTYKKGYFRVCEGIFVDQLYINLVPIFFKKVFILGERGYNMAPWNFHERFLKKEDENYLVNEKDKLKFFHFSSFKVNGNEFPLHYYNRFRITDRPDLLELYTDYNQKIISAGHAFFSKIRCVYLDRYQIKQAQLIELKKREDWLRKTLPQKMVLKIFKFIPSNTLAKIKRGVQNL